MNSAVRPGTHDPPVTWGRMTMCEAMVASHTFLEQPGKLRLFLQGQSLADLVAEGGRALGTHMCGQAKRAPSGPWLEVEIRADGREAVLANWLNRLLHLARRNRWAPVECQVIAANNSGLRARVRGVALGVKPRLGKAVICPSSLFAPGGCGLQAEVILEVPRPASGHRARLRRASASAKGRA